MTDIPQSGQGLAAQSADLPPGTPGLLPGPDPSTSPTGYVHVPNDGYQPIEVLLGNDSALEAYRDPQSDDPARVRFRAQAGQQITRVLVHDRDAIVEGGRAVLDLFKRVEHVVASMGFHFQAGSGPAWVEVNPGSHPQQEADDLEQLLAMRFGLQDKRQRPDQWGADNPDPHPDATPQVAASAARGDDTGGADAQVITAQDVAAVPPDIQQPPSGGGAA